MRENKYACIECGFETLKWMGRCTNCGNWNTLKIVSNGVSRSKKIAKVEKVGKVISHERIKTGFSEFDRTLGGGFVKGEVILISGEPGVGKTTLLLQLLQNIIKSGKNGVYISAEESLEQISYHSKRLGINVTIEAVFNNDIDKILSTISKNKYQFAVIDSIQTVKTEDLKGIPGAIGQVKECTSRIVEYAKKFGIVVCIVGHITKGGDLAGPKTIEHLVDGVFYLEGDSSHGVRILRGVKNRFGSTSEIGVFTFDHLGFADATNPSEMFVLTKDSSVGVSKGVIFEGNRAMIIEIQSLISKSVFALPQRVVSGIKRTKVQMFCALLSKHLKMNFLDKDVYINIANGFKVSDSSLDLSICISLVSSYLDRKVDSDIVAIGEVSLTGRIHNTPYLNEKLKALRRLGYSDIIIPEESLLTKTSKKCKYRYISHVSDIVKIFKLK